MKKYAKYMALAVTLALLPLLPARIPVHWNVDGQIDGSAGTDFLFFRPAGGGFLQGQRDCDEHSSIR